MVILLNVCARAQIYAGIKEERTLLYSYFTMLSHYFWPDREHCEMRDHNFSPSPDTGVWVATVWRDGLLREVDWRVLFQAQLFFFLASLLALIFARRTSRGSCKMIDKVLLGICYPILAFSCFSFLFCWKASLFPGRNFPTQNLLLPTHLEFIFQYEWKSAGS